MLKKMNCDIPFYQVIGNNGQLVPDQQFPNGINKERCIELYQAMLLARTLDHQAIALQRTGQLSTYPACYGQEAIYAAIGLGMASQDILCPYYRDHIAMILRGVDVVNILNYWGGRESGNAVTKSKLDLPYCVPIASQCLHAAGIAYAQKLQKNDSVVVCTIGDGATSKGDFYEALNFSALYDLGIVFVINNNQWAISTPRSIQTKVTSLAQKTLAAGEMLTSQVDGNDAVAMLAIIEQAIQCCRNKKGPVLIEGLCYRLCDHTTADDAKRYHNDKIYNQAKEDEPIERLKKVLEKYFSWTLAENNTLISDTEKRVKDAISSYQNQDTPKITDMFDYLYEKLPETIQAQRQELIEAWHNRKAYE